MAFSRLRVVSLAAVLLLPGCSLDVADLWPSLDAEDPAAADTFDDDPLIDEPISDRRVPVARRQAPAAPARTAAAQPRMRPAPTLGQTDFTPGGVTPGMETGTFVGKKVVELRQELQRLQNSISNHNVALQEVRGKMVQDSQRYHGTLAAINTTPGNPILVQQFNSAQTEIDRLAADIAEMNKLTNEVAEDATMAAFLAESAHAAFGVSGAVDEDHRQLAILEDEINRTVVLIDRLRKEVTDDVRRQTNYVATERSNLNLLSAGIKSGEIYGASLINQAMASAAQASGAGPGAPRAMNTEGRRPLMVIRFDRPSVSYDQALYNTLKKVLDRRPDAVFDLVAVAPTAGGPAKVAVNSAKARQNAERVLRSLMEMGMPPNRVAVSAKTSSRARSNEVHLYLR